MNLKRIAIAVSGLGVLAVVFQRFGLLCLVRNAHNLKRHTLGGFRCSTCGAVGADMDAFRGHFGDGFVAPNRKMYDRHTGTVTSTSHYEPTARGH